MPLLFRIADAVADGTSADSGDSERACGPAEGEEPPAGKAAEPAGFVLTGLFVGVVVARVQWSTVPLTLDRGSLSALTASENSCCVFV